MIRIQEQVALGPLTTFGVGGPARYFTEATTEAEVAEAVQWADARNVPLFVLGGGSNLVVSDAGFSGLVLKMSILGITQEGCHFQVGAGENWDAFVQRTVQAGCGGIECMAGIPGTVGGTPVQNVGAYGQDVSETVSSVRALDRSTGTFVEIPKAECSFRYRESRFNTDEPGRYIVTGVSFDLKPHAEPNLKYADIRKWFDNKEKPTLLEVADAVRVIRRSKGMYLVEGDPDFHSAGSFFKNPIVPVSDLESISTAVGGAEIPHWSVGDGSHAKLPAAWLLEKAGFVKGFGEGPIGISSRHTLALVNRGGATAGDVEKFEAEVVAGVKSKFGITLTREPVRLG